MYIKHPQHFCDVSDRGVGTSQDGACAVTRFMKLFFLTSEYCMKTSHTNFFYF